LPAFALDGSHIELHPFEDELLLGYRRSRGFGTISCPVAALSAVVADIIAPVAGSA
jgi:hypothetical protein